MSWELILLGQFHSLLLSCIHTDLLIVEWYPLGMEAKGRGSAVVALVVVLMVVQCEMSVAAIYTVGGAAGWTFNMVGWPRGKRFRAGDILVFNYNRAAHNVVAVNKAAYDSCKAPRGAGQYQTGRDRIKLAKGPNYFVCTFPGHCEAGMKIAVTAA